jgi:hypothetical protein
MQYLAPCQQQRLASTPHHSINSAIKTIIRDEKRWLLTRHTV